ncbi:hypothetical protein [Bradyrhizobium sp. McL0616]|uniref:hypothetical protein n=1 Tax=Bradyrhizobium sp. McL0616 TaxID=3415674 RepID=UPI003CFB45C3
MTVSCTSFVTPAGNVAPAIHDRNYNAPFNVSATFSGDCGQGEYRQYVSGAFKANGSALSHVLCGSVVLMPTVLQEDGCRPTGCTAYGYRICPAHPYNHFLPNRSDGCEFRMYDAPGFSNISAGNTYSIDLAFEGKAINAAQGGAVLISKSWTSQGSIVTESHSAIAAVGLGPADKIVGAFYTHNSVSGEPELHVVISRNAGLPPLDATSFAVTMLDAAGHRATLPHPPAVHEVGNLARVTTSIVYELPPGQWTPLRVEIVVNHGVVTLNVRQK